MDWLGWATFGLGATTLLTGVMAGAQLLGITRMDIPLILGTIFVDDPDRARLVGFLVHLVDGQIFALMYAGAFVAIGRANWQLGALFGLGHGLGAITLFMPLIGGIHPRVATDRSGPSLSATLEPPGAFGLNYGLQTPAVALFAHVAYGALLGLTLFSGGVPAG